MSSLFIIGNGFDIAHGFETSFNQFKSWLCDEYEATTSDEIIEIPDYQTDYKRIEEYDEKKMANFFYNLISNILGDEWNNFESALSTLDWAEHIRASVESLRRAGNFEPQHLMNIAEEFASQLRDMAFILKDSMFRSWAKQIDIKKPKNISHELKSIIENNECYFLNFNYTDTLELYYGVEDVCHIHGRATSHDELIIGHFGKVEIPNGLEHESLFYMLQVSGYINTIREGYKKDVIGIFQKNQCFFGGLANVTDIYIHGFSFSDVDLQYFKMLFQNVRLKNVVFHLHSYCKEDWSKFRKKLIELGAISNNIVPFRLKELPDMEL